MPARTALVGRHVTLQPLDAARHAGDLFEASHGSEAANASEVERAITAFARTPHGALIATAVPRLFVHGKVTIGLAARYRLPAVYPFRNFVTDGGLASYGANAADSYRRAAAYVHRILKGEKPADLPVQLPTKYELVINPKTAKALGVSVSPALLARTDEVIE